MSRMTVLAWLIVAVGAGLAPVASAACGDLYGTPPVGWAKSLREAQNAAQAKSEAYAIYFCAPESAATAGEGARALAASRVANKNKLITVFDNPAVPYELRKAGISQLVKIIADQRNAKLMARYGAGPNTLVICGPGAERLFIFSGEQCKQTVICSTAKGFPALYAAWLFNAKKS